MAADLSLRGPGFHLLCSSDVESIAQGLIRGAALGAVALMGPLAVVKIQVAVRSAWTCSRLS